MEGSEGFRGWFMVCRLNSARIQRSDDYIGRAKPADSSRLRELVQESHQKEVFKNAVG